MGKHGGMMDNNGNNQQKIDLKKLSAKLFIYAAISGAINFGLAFMMFIGTHMISRTSDYFNDIIEPNFMKAYWPAPNSCTNL
jgi:hypothetical protein